MMKRPVFFLLFLFFAFFHSVYAIELGIDRLFTPEFLHLVYGKKVGVATNHTGISSSYVRTEQIFESEHTKGTCTLVCFFCPEHGFRGADWAEASIDNTTHECGVPIYSLHGVSRRPSEEMLQGLDVIVFDMQDIGCRSYTYISTLFYLMEEAAKKNIEVIVLDRPNPLGGEYVDGPMMESKWRSFVGYINVPYCHGMTVGELAQFFKSEYNISCPLHVVPMKGWKRSDHFSDTGLPWIPPSPNIPDALSSFFYPTTGILGTLSYVSIGIGYTLPFQVVTAPWIDSKRLVSHLNQPKLPGVHFLETWIRPFWGFLKEKNCQGTHIFITDPTKFSPIKTFYLILSTLREIYPSKTLAAVKNLSSDNLFYKVCGTDKIAAILKNDEHPYKALLEVHKEERAQFLKLRSFYLIKEYSAN